MEYRDVVGQLIEIVTPLAKGRIVVDEATELVGELALDSLQVMNLMLSVEDRFDVSIPVNILSDVRTVRDLAIQIEKLVNQH